MRGTVCVTRMYMDPAAAAAAAAETGSAPARHHMWSCLDFGASSQQRSSDWGAVVLQLSLVPLAQLCQASHEAKMDC